MGITTLLQAWALANSKRAEAQMWADAMRANGDEAGAFDRQRWVDHYIEEADKIASFLSSMGITDPARALVADRGDEQQWL